MEFTFEQEQYLEKQGNRRFIFFLILTLFLMSMAFYGGYLFGKEFTKTPSYSEHPLVMNCSSPVCLRV